MSSEFPATTTQLYNVLLTSSEYIKEHLPPAETSIVLGSGLSNFYMRLEDRISIDFTSIPYLPTPTVSGHKGTLFYGTVKGVPVYCWGGRLHGYEGYYNYEICFIAHLSALLGCNTLLLTNAAGGAIEGNNPGDIALITGHINHFCRDPTDTYLHSLFANKHMSLDYSQSFLEHARRVAGRHTGINCFEGTYIWLRGPSFELPYEVDVYRKLGAQLFGMSTVPEILVGQAHGMRVLGISVISNMAAGLIQGEILTHEMVKERISKVQSLIEDYCIDLVSELPPFEGQVITDWVNEVEPAHFQKIVPEISLRTIEKAVEWVQMVIGGKSVRMGFVVNSHSRPNLQNCRQVYYKEIPGFPQFSPASHSGRLVFGLLNGEGVLCFINCCYDGLTVYEAYFAVQLLVGLGAGHIHYIVPGLLGGENKIVNINDYINYHLQGPAERAVSMPSYISSLGDSLIMAFPGPSLPSAAEREMAHRLGAEHCTIANMAVLNESSNRGAKHSLSAYKCDFISECISSEELVAHMEQVSSLVSVQTVPLTETSFPVRTGIELLPPPETPEDLEKLAAMIGEYQPTLCVIATSQLGNAFSVGMNFEKSWAFSSDLPQIIHIAEKVIYVFGSPVLKHNHNHQKLVYPYFLINLLGVKKVVILDSLGTASEECPPGTWVKVTNHCGLSYFNPLFGHNIEKWGVRFPDISETYKFDLEWSKELVEKGAVCREAVAMFTNPSRALHSKSLVRVAEFCGASVIAKNSVNAVIVLGHRKLDEPIKSVISLGYVFHDPIKEVFAPPPSGEHLQAIQQLIARFNS